MNVTVVGKVKTPKGFFYHAVFESKSPSVDGFLTTSFFSSIEHNLDEEVTLKSCFRNGKYYYYERNNK